MVCALACDLYGGVAGMRACNGVLTKQGTLLESHTQRWSIQRVQRGLMYFQWVCLPMPCQLGIDLFVWKVAILRERIL